MSKPSWNPEVTSRIWKENWRTGQTFRLCIINLEEPNQLPGAPCCVQLGFTGNGFEFRLYPFLAV
jgi:hypothetical protein